MAYDRDDISLFTYDNLPDAIAEGIQKFVDDAKDKEMQTAAESLLASSLSSVRKFDSTDAGLEAIYNILKSMADGKTDADVNAAFKTFVEQARSSNVAKDNQASSTSDKHSSKDDQNKPDKQNAEDKEDKEDKDNSVMGQTKSARKFFSDLGIPSLSKSVAKWASLFDSLGTKASTIKGVIGDLSDAAEIMKKYMPSSISEAFNDIDGTLSNLKTGLSEVVLTKAKDKTGHFTDTKSETSNWFSGASAGNSVEHQQKANRDDKSKVSEADRNNEALSLVVSSMSVMADNVALNAKSMTTDQQSESAKKIAKDVSDEQAISESIEATSTASDIADKVMSSTKDEADESKSESKSESKADNLDAVSTAASIADKVMTSTKDESAQQKQNWDSDLLNSLVIEDGTNDKKTNSDNLDAVSTAASIADKVMSKGATSAATDAVAGAAADAAGSGMLGAALGGLSKIAGPLAVVAGAVTWGLSQARQATIAGNLQGGGLPSGIGMGIENFGQDLAHNLGFTDVSSKDLQNYRQSASKAGYDIESDQGRNAIDVQKWAKNNGLDSSVALQYANSMLHAGESANDVKEQFDKLKDTADELGIDFNNLAEAAADNATRLRQAGVEDSGEQATEDTQELEQLLRGSGFDEVTAKNIASVTNSDMFKMSVAQMAAQNGDQNAIYGIQSDGAYALRYLNEYGGKDAIRQAYDNALGYVGRMTEGMSTSNGGDLSQQAMQNQLAQQFMGITPNSGAELSSAIQRAYGDVVVNVTNTIGTDTQDRVQANAIRNNSYYGNGQSNIQVNNSGARR